MPAQIPRDLMQAGASLGAGPVRLLASILALRYQVLGQHAGLRARPRFLHHTWNLLGGGRTIMISMLVSRNALNSTTSWRHRSPSAWCCLVADRRDLLCRQPLHSAYSIACWGKNPAIYTHTGIPLVVTCALVLLYLILPILIIAPMSFSAARYLSFPPPSLSLRWYQDVGNRHGCRRPASR